MKQVELYINITQLIYLRSPNLTYLVYKLSSTLLYQTYNYFRVILIHYHHSLEYL